MVYQNPTFFGLAYACRLFRQIDVPSGLDQLGHATGGTVDLQNPNHVEALLAWLNDWQCRIDGKSFTVLAAKLTQWFESWNPRLLKPEVTLTDASDHELNDIADAYAELKQVRGLGPTITSKILFAVRPEAAIPWDAPIQTEFQLQPGERNDYRAMLALSKSEAEAVIADAARCGVASEQCIPAAIGSPARTLVRLIDEYHWITITRRHEVPSAQDLKQWIGWASPQCEGER
jgi:hypothetical protein